MELKDYIQTLFVSEDEVLQSIEDGLAERKMPKISVPPEIGEKQFFCWRKFQVLAVSWKLVL